MVVIDASVANKLFLPNEESYKEADDIFRKHLERQNKIIVPDLIFYEVANTLATKTALTIDQAIKSLNQLYKYNLIVYHPNNKAIAQAAKWSKKYSITVYDASYAVLAQQKKCDLVTADQKLVKQLDLPFVKYLGEN